MNKQKKKGFTSDTLKETAVMTIAVGIIAAAVYFFLIPSQTAISSISALAIIIAHYVPLHVSTVTMVLNVVLLLIGFVTCGKEFGARRYIRVSCCQRIWRYLNMYYRILNH